MSNLNFHLIKFVFFRFEKLGSSDGGMAALNKELLRLSPVLYTTCLFHKAISGNIYLVCADTISIPSA